MLTRNLTLTPILILKKDLSLFFYEHSESAIKITIGCILTILGLDIHLRLSRLQHKKPQSSRLRVPATAGGAGALRPFYLEYGKAENFKHVHTCLGRQSRLGEHVYLSRMARKQHRNWCFTLNNYTDEEVLCIPDHIDQEFGAEHKPNALTYLAVSEEVGRRGTPHLQGFLQMRLKGMKTGGGRALGKTERKKGNTGSNSGAGLAQLVSLWIQGSIPWCYLFFFFFFEQRSGPSITPDLCSLAQQASTEKQY